MTIQLPPIVGWVDSVEAAVLVVETAGALLSPLAPGLTNLDLTAALEPDAVVLVAPDRLGVLHDVTAALFALHHLEPGLPEPVVALMAPAEADGSTGTNGEELQVLGIARRVVTLPRAGVGDAVIQQRARALVELVGADCNTADPSRGVEGTIRSSSAARRTRLARQREAHRCLDSRSVAPHQDPIAPHQDPILPHQEPIGATHPRAPWGRGARRRAPSAPRGHPLRAEGVPRCKIEKMTRETGGCRARRAPRACW